MVQKLGGGQVKLSGLHVSLIWPLCKIFYWQIQICVVLLVNFRVIHVLYILTHPSVTRYWSTDIYSVFLSWSGKQSSEFEKLVTLKNFDHFHLKYLWKALKGQYLIVLSGNAWPLSQIFKIKTFNINHLCKISDEMQKHNYIIFYFFFIILSMDMIYVFLNQWLTMCLFFGTGKLYHNFKLTCLDVELFVLMQFSNIK